MAVKKYKVVTGLNGRMPENEFPWLPLAADGLPETWVCGYCGRDIPPGQQANLIRDLDRKVGLLLCQDCFTFFFEPVTQ